MSENTPVFEIINNDKKILKNMMNEYTNTRVEIKTKIWKLFKGIVEIRGLSIPDALTESIIMWIENIENVKHICNTCDNIIDSNEYYIYKKLNGEVVHYCSFKCLNNNKI